jgi:hypothetical protein
VDEAIESLRRTHARDGDIASSLAYAAALERTGRVAEAWSVVALSETPELGEFAARFARQRPAWLLEHLRAATYRRARLTIQHLARNGEGRNPAIVFLALSTAAGENLIRGFATEGLRSTFEEGSIGNLLPMRLVQFAQMGDGSRRDTPERWQARARGALEARGRDFVALLPWVVALSAPSLNVPMLSADARAACVRELGHEPPFTFDEIERATRRD